MQHGRSVESLLMPPHLPTFGPLDEVLGTLLETWRQRDSFFGFKMNYEERLLLLSKPPDNEVGAKELPDGRIHVVYQPSPEETVEEYCSIDRAVRLIDALMSREKLEPVTLPAEPAPQPTKAATAPAKSGWLARLFGRK